MSQINIEKSELKKLLCSAYEAGWHGTKEMKEEVAEDLLKTIPTPITFTTGEVIMDSPFFSLENNQINMELDNRPIFISTESLAELQIALSPDAWRNAGDG